jgi:hypothetical protein
LLPGRYAPARWRRTGRIARFTGRGRRGRSDELERGEFGAGAEAELAEHVAQVEVDGAGAEEQLGGGAYNILLIPVAAGALYAWHGILLDPILAAAAPSTASRFSRGRPHDEAGPMRFSRKMIYAPTR